MRVFNLLAIVSIPIGFMGATAYDALGASVLLGTWNTGAGWGSARDMGPQRPALMYFGPGIEAGVPLFEAFDLPGPFPVHVRNTVSAENDPDFLAFAALMTDGTSERQAISLGFWGDEGPRVLGPTPEGTVFGGMIDIFAPMLGPDFVGYEITHITQDLTVVMESDWLGPDGHVYATYWAFGGDYEFYGVPVPEPATWMLLVLGSVALLRRRR